MNIDLSRYEQFGWDYEYINPLTDKEVTWYVKFAQKTGGPILELACGTARLLVSIARVDLKIVGVDLSEGMLKIARKRISQLSPEVQSRIQIHTMDMSNFKFDCKFGLIYIADNSFCQLRTREQQLSCLKCVYHHLRPGGKFLVTVSRFDTKKFVNGRRDTCWSKLIRNPNTGDLVQRKLEMQLTGKGKWIRGFMYYKTINANGDKTIDEFSFETPVMFKDDYISLFSEAGFPSTVFVDYKDQEDDGKSPILCFVCNKVL